jgi:hypothetical protein
VGWGAVGVSDRFADARACGVGDVIVDGSIRWERLRPLGSLWAAASGREPRAMREPAGRVRTIGEWMGLARAIGSVCIAQSVTGGERGGPELAQGMEAAAGELAGDG